MPGRPRTRRFEDMPPQVMGRQAAHSSSPGSSTLTARRIDITHTISEGRTAGGPPDRRRNEFGLHDAVFRRAAPLADATVKFLAYQRAGLSPGVKQHTSVPGEDTTTDRMRAHKIARAVRLAPEHKGAARPRLS